MSVNAFSSQSKLQAYLCCVFSSREKRRAKREKKERYCDIGAAGAAVQEKTFVDLSYPSSSRWQATWRAISDGKQEHREWRIELDGSDRSAANQSNKGYHRQWTTIASGGKKDSRYAVSSLCRALGIARLLLRIAVTDCLAGDLS